MNKSDIAATVAAALKNGDEVRLIGFGTFSVSDRAARECRNPSIGEKIQLAASRQRTANTPPHDTGKHNAAHEIS